ncbi:nucleolus and neural progenitor protein isoform X1 [Amphiprion ocellaris]|uniref:nucleolus and neural progenitor protein isoform X1 n=1 Tax=Amphiprion ocellaris TaxID=80972 RepID=UPI0024114036|nr:nucleolus and neural progenitor protein isoform X1 [Amphiprion ocellaris]
MNAIGWFASACLCEEKHGSRTVEQGFHVQGLLGANGTVLQLIRSEILQTEVRVLYELLYILNNSYRGNKTFKGLQQVEQCVNRLKNMKLDIALQDLADLCPNKIQRKLSIKAGECDVPSQPRLEWVCLKVLGAAQLMSCALNRCSRAFILTKQQMKWEEFVVLNMVITSMLSRLWVIFRGLLVSLSTLYQQLLVFLKDVAVAKPMSFLTDFSLPTDMVQFLAPFDTFLLTKHPAYEPHPKDYKEKLQQKKKSSVKVSNQGQTGKNKDDLGVAVERDLDRDTDLKPFIKIFKNFTKRNSSPENTHKAEKKLKLKKLNFKKQVREAPTFTHMAAHLEEMILWCKSQRMEKEKRLLTFLQLKCRKMKCLEEAGYNVQRKLQTFRQEACWASSPNKSVPKSFLSPSAMRRKARLRIRLSLTGQIASCALRTGVKKKRLIGQQKATLLSVPGLSKDNQQNRTTHEAAHPTTDSRDDIDDIFASVGL